MACSATSTCAEQGVDESIAQFARNHTGVGLTQQMVIAQNLPLPPVDYMPASIWNRKS